MGFDYTVVIVVIVMHSSKRRLSVHRPFLLLFYCASRKFLRRNFSPLPLRLCTSLSPSFPFHSSRRLSRPCRFVKSALARIQDGVQFERVDNFTRFYEALIGFGPMKAKVAIALHAIPEFPTLASAIPFHQRSDNDQWNTIARTLTEQKTKTTF